jgi:hypothetical protein
MPPELAAQVEARADAFEHELRRCMGEARPLPVIDLRDPEPKHTSWLRVMAAMIDAGYTLRVVKSSPRDWGCPSTSRAHARQSRSANVRRAARRASGRGSPRDDPDESDSHVALAGGARL